MHFRKLPIALASASLLLACGGGSAPPPEPPFHKLAVDGRTLVDAETRAPVVLQGVTFASGVWQWDAASEAGALASVQYMQGEADFDRVHAWGANAVSLYLNWYWFQDEAGWQWLDRTLDACARNHLYVVPSLVVYPAGGWRGGPDFWASPQAQDDLEAFWTQFARRYRGRPEIAGADLLNEPQGAPGDQEADRAPVYAAYQTRLIDAVRAIDPDLIVFIEGEWGHLGLPIERPDLVYVIHYYEPFYFSAEGYTWISNGNVPVGSRYPGEMVMGAAWRQSLTTWVDLTSSAERTGWTTIDAGPSTVPGGVDLVYPTFDVAGTGAGDEVDVDAVEYRIHRKGAAAWTAWTAVLNGSFESPGATDDGLHWLTWQPAGQGGTLARAQVSDADDGAWIWRLRGCTGHCQTTLFDGWVGTLGAIPVAEGDEVELRLRARWRGAGQLDAGFGAAQSTREYWDRARLQAAVAQDIVGFSAAHHVPVLVGEFSPSLVAPRADALAYEGDLMDAFQDAGLSWTYYVYRENWPASRRYLGLWNCPAGTPTGAAACTEETDVRDVLIEHLRR